MKGDAKPYALETELKVRQVLVVEKAKGDESGRSLGAGRAVAGGCCALDTRRGGRRHCFPKLIPGSLRSNLGVEQAEAIVLQVPDKGIHESRGRRWLPSAAPPITLLRKWQDPRATKHSRALPKGC